MLKQSANTIKLRGFSCLCFLQSWIINILDGHFYEIPRLAVKCQDSARFIILFLGLDFLVTAYFAPLGTTWRWAKGFVMDGLNFTGEHPHQMWIVYDCMMVEYWNIWLIWLVWFYELVHLTVTTCYNMLLARGLQHVPPLDFLKPPKKTAVPGECTGFLFFGSMVVLHHHGS